jgi:hypothetical protein
MPVCEFNFCAVHIKATCRRGRPEPMLVCYYQVVSQPERTSGPLNPQHHHLRKLPPLPLPRFRAKFPHQHRKRLCRTRPLKPSSTPSPPLPCPAFPRLCPATSPLWTSSAGPRPVSQPTLLNFSILTSPSLGSPPSFSGLPFGVSSYSHYLSPPKERE